LNIKILTKLNILICLKHFIHYIIISSKSFRIFKLNDSIHRLKVSLIKMRKKNKITSKNELVYKLILTYTKKIHFIYEILYTDVNP